MSKNIVEMINALNKQHKYAIADAVHNVDLVDDYDGAFEIITKDDLKAYFSEIGWNPGTYKRTIAGIEYTFGTDDGYPLYTYPFENVPAKGKYFKIDLLNDTTSFITFDFDSKLVNGTPTSVSKKIVTSHLLGQREVYIYMTNKVISCTAFGYLLTSYSGSTGIFDSTIFTRETFHGRMDRAMQIAINTDCIGMTNGINYDKSKGTSSQKKQVQLTLGSTTLTEAKLQALLALINQ